MTDNKTKTQLTRILIAVFIIAVGYFIWLKQDNHSFSEHDIRDSTGVSPDVNTITTGSGETYSDTSTGPANGKTEPAGTQNKRSESNVAPNSTNFPTTPNKRKKDSL